MTYSWFRMYSEAVDDEKLRLLAFEDRWHFVAILCCKSKGILDEKSEMLRRKVAVKLGLDLRALDEAARRLSEVGLIDEKTLQPLAWDHRQFQSDSSTERVRAYRNKMKRCGNVSVTAQDTDTDTDTEKNKPTRRSRVAVTKPDDVSQEVWNDYQQLRKTKRAPITQTSLDGLRREAGKAGMSVQQAMALCCAKGWQGFDSTWVGKQGKQGKDAQQREWLNRLTGRDEDAIDATARLVG
jgi:hypothetical protein